MTLRIGITGGIGSGKSTVARLFAQLGVPVLDTDEVARELVRPGMPALARIAETFGADLLTPAGELDRRRLRDRVFAAEGQRRRLEQILHPLIRRKLARWTAAQTAPYCLLLIPLLIEAGWNGEVDRILVIDAPEQQQLARATARDAASAASVRAIIASQCSRTARLAAADDVIVNDGGLDGLQPQIERLHREYLALATRRQ